MFNKMSKGDHEAAMEKAKQLLSEHVGMEEIVKTTHLTVYEINKARGDDDE